MAWHDGQASSPANGDVIVDTGPIDGPTNVTLAAAIFASLACAFELQQVEDDGTTVVHRQKMAVIAAGATLNVAPIYVTLQHGERLRIVTAQALTLGNVGASIFYF